MDKLLQSLENQRFSKKKIKKLLTKANEFDIMNKLLTATTKRIERFKTKSKVWLEH